MEEKPCTDLVVLPSLQLIPLESLPKRRGEELVSLKNTRADSFGEAVGSFALSFMLGLYAALWALVLFLSLVNPAPFVITLIALFVCAGSSTASGFLFRNFMRELRIYRQAAISPQLKTNAEAEAMLLDAAKETNAQIAEWNVAAQKATEHDLGGRYLRSLKQYRADLSARTEKIKQLARRIGAK